MRGSGSWDGGQITLGFELQDVLVGLERFAGLIEKLGEVLGVGAVFFFDQVVELLDLSFSVEIDAAHGTLG